MSLLQKIYVATKRQLIDSVATQQKNKFSNVDEEAHILVSPFLENHPWEPEKKSYRCYLWVKLASENKRACIVEDLFMKDLVCFTAPNEEQMRRIIFMMLESLPIEIL